MTMTSPPPKLNRLITVTGASTETTVRHTAHAYQRVGQPDRDNSGWYSHGVGARRASDLVRANIQRIIFAPETYGRSGYVARPSPNFAALLGAGGDHLYLLDPAGDDAARWPIREVGRADAVAATGGPVRDTAPPRVWVLTLGPGELVGDDFNLAPMLAYDHLHRFNVGEHPDLWSVESLEVQTPNDRAVEKRVWARITERGARVGLVTILDSGQSRQGQEETAEIVIRYEPALTIGGELIDDLGRHWNVENSRTILDRRYLAFECSRPVDTIPPDVPDIRIV